MTKSLTLALTLVVLAVVARLSVAQGVQPRDQAQTLPPNSAQIGIAPGGDTKKLVTKAIASTIITRKGKEFPSVAKVAGSDTPLTGWASCEPGDTQTFTQNAAIDLESPKRVKKTNTYPSSPPERKLVSPPNADWVIQSYKRVVTSAGAPYEAGDSAFPAGYSFLTSGNYSSVKSTMHSFVGSLNVSAQIKADLNAKLESLISNISSYGYSVSGSHGTVEHTALVRGTGITNTTTAHSWYHGYIDGTLVCSPAYLRDQNALIARLKTWVNEVLKKIPFSARSPAVM